MRLFAQKLISVLALLAMLCVHSGCGGKPDFTPPKTELTEEEKRQVKELDEHRQREWAPPPAQPEGS